LDKLTFAIRVHVSHIFITSCCAMVQGKERHFDWLCYGSRERETFWLVVLWFKGKRDILIGCAMGQGKERHFDWLCYGSRERETFW